uniref:Uncharacterized protein n=1 Tax=Caenorhabditis japonica TaxID=281687 RepID=A0A8R1IQH7_CAEJA
MHIDCPLAAGLSAHQLLTRYSLSAHWMSTGCPPSDPPPTHYPPTDCSISVHY